MSLFADLAGIARDAVDAVHGEAMRFMPMDRQAGPHGRPVASTSRSGADIVVALWRDTELEARRRAQPLIGQTGQKMVNRSPELYGSTRHPGCAIGDRLHTLDRHGTAVGPAYEIVSRDPDGIGNTILGLCAIKD